MYAKKIWFDRHNILIETTDGKQASMPLCWFPKLLAANLELREKYELWADGGWIHWEEIGEDLSADGFFTFKKEEKKR